MNANGIDDPLAATRWIAGVRIAPSPYVEMNWGSAMAATRVSVRKRTFPLRPNIVSATGKADSVATFVVSGGADTPASASIASLSGARSRSASLRADATARAMPATATTAATSAIARLPVGDPSHFMPAI